MRETIAKRRGGDLNLKIFENQLFQYIATIKMGVVLKFEAKRSISFDFVAYSVIKDFE